MITTAVLLSLTTAAYAEPLGIIGYAEYAVEAESVETAVGTEFTISDGLTVTPMVVGFSTADEFGFDRLEVTATYDATEDLDLYVRVETNDDLEYAEATVGVGFSF